MNNVLRGGHRRGGGGGRAPARGVLPRRRAARHGRQRADRRRDRGAPAREAAGARALRVPAARRPASRRAEATQPDWAVARRSARRHLRIPRRAARLGGLGGAAARRAPVLGVVHSPLPPDRGADTIAWAEGARADPAQRPPGRARVSAHRALDAGRVRLGHRFVGAAADRLVARGSRRRATSRCRASPTASRASPAGDGVGDGLDARRERVRHRRRHGARRAPRAAWLLDAQGREIVLKGEPTRARERLLRRRAARRRAQLAALRLEAARGRSRAASRASRSAFRAATTSARLARAQGCLLGQVIGDSLGSRVEFKTAAEIARLFPGGVRELGDGGVYHTMAGQPTDDSEMALDARALHHRGEAKYRSDKVLDAYRGWLHDAADRRRRDDRARPARPAHHRERVERLADARLADRHLGRRRSGARGARRRATTRRSRIRTRSASRPAPAYCAAIAAGVGGASRDEMLEAALAHSERPGARGDRGAARRARRPRTSRSSRAGC